MSAHLSIYLDFLRVVAAFTVFLGHFAQGWLGGGLFWQAASYGHPAVIVFFVLSGYVIAYTAETRENSLRSFAIARLARIYSVALPALILSAILLLAGTAIDPAHYAELAKRDQPNMVVPYVTQFFAALVFISESWGLHIRPFGNTPYWSLAYEVWYYVIFACVTFLRGRQRLSAVFLACLVAGPKILLMAPIWVAGILAWRWRKRMPSSIALLLATVTAVLFYLLAGNELALESSAFRGPWWPMEFRITDHLIGLVVALHIAAVAALRYQGKILSARLGTAIKTMASYTFSVYLFHYPLFVFFAAIIPGAANDPGHRVILVVSSVMAIIGLAQFSERKYILVRSFLQRAWTAKTPQL